MQCIRCLLLLLLANTLCITGADPWVLEQGQQSLSSVYVYEQFDEVWIKGDDIHMDFAKVKQQTFYLRYARGLTDHLSLELSSGYTKTQMRGKSKKFGGLADSKLGLNWQLLNEYQDQPLTLSIRLTGTLRGNYDRASAGNPHSPGDKASSLGTSLHLAKTIGQYLSVVAQAGYQKRYNQAPDREIYQLGLIASLTPRWSMSARYQVQNSRGNLDIKGPGFDPSRFHQVEEDQQGYTVDSSFELAAGNSIYCGLAAVTDGRNTGESEIFFIGYGFSF